MRNRESETERETVLFFYCYFDKSPQTWIEIIQKYFVFWVNIKALVGLSFLESLGEKVSLLFLDSLAQGPLPPTSKSAPL